MGNALARQTGETGGKEPVAAVQPVGLLSHTLAAVSRREMAKDFVPRTLVRPAEQTSPLPCPIRAD